MSANRFSIFCALGVLCAFAGLPRAAAQTGDFLLVRRSLDVQSIKLTAIEDQVVVHLPAEGNWVRVPLADCIALLKVSHSTPKAGARGLLMLATGERVPGEAISANAQSADSLAWNHREFGRMDVPIKLIETVLFAPGIDPPQAGQYDVVLLANGDRQDGIVVSLGDPVALDVQRGKQRQVIHIPLARIAAVTMVTPAQPPSGRRVWFEDGTVIDVQSIAVGEDGLVRLAGSSLLAGTQPTRVTLADVAAILLDPNAMVPLASLAPTRVEGPPTRYTLPRPAALDPSAPLGLSDLDYRGPIVARYALPAGADRFTAIAELPYQGQTWGDCELVVRSNDDEVFRTRLNEAQPAATINVPLTGRELTIEITEGANGPIQDQVILRRAMVLKSR
ncbi:MAG: hypothetical protein L0Y44_16150 [Phycisphaerales bacterium]|nr:hypothetical protein [Phycisphaerales bacterium]MCI0632175.1 hypothetical protein [Phycisphaerales bacterium]